MRRFLWRWFGWSGAWRTYIEARAVLLAGEALRVNAIPVRRNLALARYYAAMRHSLRDWITGRAVEGAWFNLNTASAQLMLWQPDETVAGRVPEVLAVLRAYLPVIDPRRVAVERRFADNDPLPLTAADRQMLVTALHGAYFVNGMEHGRVRRFRNMAILGSLLLTVVIVVVILVAAARPDTVPMCFTAVCPTGAHADPSGGDVPLIALLGLIGATLATSRALSTGDETPGRYSPALALALLKAPTGVTTAIVGVLALNSGFVPGVTEIKSQAGILFWALVFGYAQQLLTGLLDQRAADLQKSASPTTPAPVGDEPA